MAKKKSKEKKRRERDRIHRKWREEDQTLLEFQRKAPRIKAHLRKRGLNLPFYDYLDSYPAEFKRIAEYAKATYPSLLAVHEVEPEIFSNLEGHWDALGCGNLKQVFFTIDESVADYGRRNLDANLNGATIAFLDEEGKTRTVICINKVAKCSFVHEHWQYALKIAGLCHEIGHVHDLENGTNFNVATRTLNVIEAEAFAHLFALELMAKRNLQQSFNMLADALRDAVGAGGYLGQVGTAVMERMPEYKFVDWQSMLD